ncbi:MAG: ankyrin repeat domain-containing protein [Gemmatimonadota bacterium]
MRTGSLFLMMLVLSAPALVAQSSSDGKLLAAARQGRVERVQELLDAGADVNFRNARGVTPLIQAVERRHGDVAELLLSRGAEVCGTALHRIAVRGGPDLLALALAQTTDPAAIGEPALLHAAFLGRTAEVALLLDHGVDIDAVHPDRQTTPLIQACEQGKVETVRLLLERGADVHARDAHGRTALRATTHGEEASPAEREEITAMLLRAGASD